MDHLHHSFMGAGVETSVQVVRPVSPPSRLFFIGGAAFNPACSDVGRVFHRSSFAQCVKSAMSFARQRRSMVRTARFAHSWSAGE